MNANLKVTKNQMKKLQSQYTISSGSTHGHDHNEINKSSGSISGQIGSQLLQS